METIGAGFLFVLGGLLAAGVVLLVVFMLAVLLAPRFP